MNASMQRTDSEHTDASGHLRAQHARTRRLVGAEEIHRQPHLHDPQLMTITIRPKHSTFEDTKSHKGQTRVSIDLVEEGLADSR